MSETCFVLECIKQLQKAVECSICLDELQSPVETRCGHVFCGKCLFTALNERSSIPCPLCKTLIRKRGVKKALYLTAVLVAVNEVKRSAASDLESTETTDIQQVEGQKCTSFGDGSNDQLNHSGGCTTPVLDILKCNKLNKTPDLLDVVDKLCLDQNAKISASSSLRFQDVTSEEDPFVFPTSPNANRTYSCKKHPVKTSCRSKMTEKGRSDAAIQISALKDFCNKTQEEQANSRKMMVEIRCPTSKQVSRITNSYSIKGSSIGAKNAMAAVSRRQMGQDERSKCNKSGIVCNESLVQKSPKMPKRSTTQYSNRSKRFTAPKTEAKSGRAYKKTSLIKRTQKVSGNAAKTLDEENSPLLRDRKVKVPNRILSSNSSSDSSTLNHDVTNATKQDIKDKVSNWLESVDHSVNIVNDNDEKQVLENEKNDSDNSDLENFVSVSQMRSSPPCCRMRRRRRSRGTERVLSEMQKKAIEMDNEIFGAKYKQQYAPKNISKEAQCYGKMSPNLHTNDKAILKKRKKPTLKKLQLKKKSKKPDANIFDLNGLSQGVSPFSTPTEQDTANSNESNAVQNEIAGHDEVKDAFDATVDAFKGVNIPMAVATEQTAGEANNQNQTNNPTEEEGKALNVTYMVCDQRTSLNTSDAQDTHKEVSANDPNIENSLSKHTDAGRSVTDTSQQENSELSSNFKVETKTVTAVVYPQPDSVKKPAKASVAFEVPTPSQLRNCPNSIGPIRLDEMPIVCVGETEEDSEKGPLYHVETPVNSENPAICQDRNLPNILEDKNQPKQKSIELGLLDFSEPSPKEQEVVAFHTDKLSTKISHYKIDDTFDTYQASRYDDDDDVDCKEESSQESHLISMNEGNLPPLHQNSIEIPPDHFRVTNNLPNIQCEQEPLKTIPNDHTVNLSYANCDLKHGGTALKTISKTSVGTPDDVSSLGTQRSQLLPPSTNCMSLNSSSYEENIIENTEVTNCTKRSKLLNASANKDRHTKPSIATSDKNRQETKSMVLLCDSDNSENVITSTSLLKSKKSERNLLDEQKFTSTNSSEVAKDDAVQIKSMVTCHDDKTSVPQSAQDSGIERCRPHSPVLTTFHMLEHAYDFPSTWPKISHKYSDVHKKEWSFSCSDLRNPAVTHGKSGNYKFGNLTKQGKPHRVVSCSLEHTDSPDVIPSSPLLFVPRGKEKVLITDEKGPVQLRQHFNDEAQAERFCSCHKETTQKGVQVKISRPTDSSVAETAAPNKLTECLRYASEEKIHQEILHHLLCARSLCEKLAESSCILQSIRKVENVVRNRLEGHASSSSQGSDVRLATRKKRKQVLSSSSSEDEYKEATNWSSHESFLDIPSDIKAHPDDSDVEIECSLPTLKKVFKKFIEEPTDRKGLIGTKGAAAYENKDILKPEDSCEDGLIMATSRSVSGRKRVVSPDDEISTRYRQRKRHCLETESYIPAHTADDVNMECLGDINVAQPVGIIHNDSVKCIEADTADMEYQPNKTLVEDDVVVINDSLQSPDSLQNEELRVGNFHATSKKSNLIDLTFNQDSDDANAEETDKSAAAAEERVCDSPASSTEYHVRSPTPPPSQLPPNTVLDTGGIGNLLEKISELTKDEDDGEESIDADSKSRSKDAMLIKRGDEFSQNETRVAHGLSNNEAVHIAKPFNEKILERTNIPHDPLNAQSLNTLSSVTVSDASFTKPTRKLGIMASGLTGKAIGLVKLFTKKWGGKFYDSYVAGEITHAVVRTQQMRCDRTLKYLQAVASKIWVVCISWVTHSLKQKALLPEDRFEVIGDNLDTSEEMPFGPKRSRLSSLNFKLLSGYVVYCIPPFALFTEDQFVELMKLCGARAVPHAVELDDSANDEKRIITVDPDAYSNDLPDYAGLAFKYNAEAVSCSWVLDCIATFHVQPTANFPVEDLDSEIL